MLAQRGGQDQPPQPAPKEMSAPDIPGVIRGGTKVTLIRDGFNGTEGVISMPDGSMLFTEQDVDKIIKIDNSADREAGRDKKTLFIVGRGAVYKTHMIAEGLKSRAK
jgi:hypothetical protein